MARGNDTRRRVRAAVGAITAVAMASGVGHGQGLGAGGLHPGSILETSSAPNPIGRGTIGNSSGSSGFVDDPAARARYGRPGKAAVPVGMPVKGAYHPAKDYVADARVGDFNPAFQPIVASGVTGSYAGVIERVNAGVSLALARATGRALSSLLGGRDLSALEVVQIDQLIAGIEAAPWSGNDDAVGTCEEYVYEKFFDYSEYERDAASLGEDYRAMFEMGHPLLADGVQSRSGGTTTAVPTVATGQPKNVFFTFEPGRYPPDTQPFAFDPDIVSALAAGRRYYTHDLRWHGRMSQELAGQPDDLLYALAAKQRDFARLLARRAAIYKRWTDYDGAMATGLSCNQEQALPTWRWEKLFDPDDLYHGLHLIDLVAPRAFDGVVTRPSAALLARIATTSITATLLAGPSGARADLGVVSHAPLARAAQAADALAVLASRPGDRLAQAQLAAANATRPMSEEGPANADNGADWLWGPDGLPSVVEVRPCSMAGTLLFANRQAAAQRVAEALRAIDALIAEELRRARGQGCLAVAPPGSVLVASSCDWNPELFVRQMAGLLSAEREEAFHACRQATGGDFRAASHPIHRATERYAGQEPIATPARTARLGVPLLADYATSTEGVDAFIALMKDWAQAIEFQIDPRTRRPMLGHSVSDSDRMGNQLFAVDFGYGAGWRLENFPTKDEPTVQDFCGLGLSAHGNFRATGTVFGATKRLVVGDAKVASTAQGNQRHGSYGLKLEVLDVDILTPLGVPKGGQGSATLGADLRFDVVKEHRWQKQLVQLPIPTPVAGLTIMIRAGVAGQVGLAFQPSLSISAGCPALETSLTGSIVPHAALDAEVSGGVNVAGVEAGLQIGLTLLKLELPLSLAFTIYQHEGALKLQARPRLELALTTLAGKLKAYLRFIVGPPLYVTLFSWDGVELARHTLFAPEWDYSLGRIALGFKLAGGQ
jgi:hypothetical protein